MTASVDERPAPGARRSFRDSVRQPARGVPRIARLAADAALYGGIALLPAVLSIGALHLWLDRGLADYIPVRSDEVSYWHQIASFSEVGFDNGYYTYQEQVAPALSAYGFWGPMLPMLYGSLVALVGASLTVVVKLNVVLVTLAIGAALAVARAGRRRTLLVGTTIATCTPLLFYLPSGMQEPVHFGFAVVIAALFHRLLRAAPHARVRPAVWLVGVILLASLLRAPWALLLVPAGLVAFRGNVRRMLAAALTGTVAAAALGALFTIWSAPYPYGNLDKIRLAPTLGGKITVLSANLEANLHGLVAVQGALVQTGVVQRYQSMVLLLLALAGLGWAWRRRDHRSGAVAVVAVLAVLLPLAVIVAFYDIGAGTRILGPHLLLVAVLTAMAGRHMWTLVLPATLVATNLLTLGWFHHDVTTSTRVNYVGPSAAAVSEFRDELGGHLRYQPGANRWCNTILLSTDFAFFYQLLAIPAGFGVSVDLNHRFDGPLRSGYVLASDYPVTQLPDRGSGLVPLTRTSQGTLYRNPASPCFTNSA